MSGQTNFSLWNSCRSRKSVRSALLPLSVRAHLLPEMLVSCLLSGRIWSLNMSFCTSCASMSVCCASCTMVLAELNQPGVSCCSTSWRWTLSWDWDRCCSEYMVSRTSSLADRYVSQMTARERSERKAC